MNLLQTRVGQINFWLPMLLAFCLPLSTSAVTILALLMVLLWLIEGRFREKWQEISTSPTCMVVAAYFGALLLGLFWSNDPQAGLDVIRNQWKILLLPIFLTTLRWEHRWWYIAGFIAGVSAKMGSTYLVWFDLVRYADVTPQHLTRKTFHVVYNPMLALATYLLVHQILWGGLSRGWRWLLSILAALMVLNMFITEGRAGQLVFFVLLGLLLMQCFQKHRLRAFLLSLVLPVLVFVAGYQVSPVFHDRMEQARQEIADFKHNPETSVGLRLLYWQNSARIMTQSPWFGVGTGGFDSAYAAVNQQWSPGMPATDNPHNQYILVTVQLGFLGLLTLLALFGVPVVQSWREADGWQRIRLAFPVFFLTIMMSESYLIVFETAFLFSLFGAVLAKRPGTQGSATAGNAGPGQERCWLILSYRANMAGSACSQHIDDRLPFLEQQGIRPILLTGPVGERFRRYPHYRTWSLAPSGIRFELRHLLRKHLHKRWQFKLVETIVLLPVFPFYLLEKIVINLESEWSWFAAAAARGLLLNRRYRIEAIYSTGGSASAHAAALIIHRFSPKPWLAETQDPLVHDQQWRRSRVVLRLYQWLERRIAASCTAFIFPTSAAMENARRRVGEPFPGVVILPGSSPALFGPVQYAKGACCHFAHFGSLAGTRNLQVFFQALDLLLQNDPGLRSRIRVDLYGSCDQLSTVDMHRYGLESLVTYFGLIDREKALEAMQYADCLLLIQDITFFSTETIPSKVYEYLLSGRPILGLIHENNELTEMLATRSHFVAAADDPHAVQQRLAEILHLYLYTDFTWHSGAGTYRIDTAVQKLIALVPAEERQLPDE
ncbi:O-antigen ligase family protein [Desulfobulbus alkaliphilus]|uniref:O-antigen ligase family protein n=1 Tax=Desulfobulbus alkaliphilus TaxID=869814 RepID=UPI0019641CB5|nr:O-antigen ligase family protein [Desulfobulbus alkaliphilus]MBM9537970.1 O-antigen ligase family protein [Desulfobulbus alkaliphilus]